MPSERPRQRLQDVIDNIDRVTEHVATAQVSATGDFDTKTRDAVDDTIIHDIVRKHLAPLQAACSAELETVAD